MSVMSEKARVGELGEIEASRYLKKRGYKLVDHNFHSSFGEIDLIFTKGKYIVFVEVKTRSDGMISQPREAVDYVKQKKLIKTAQYYLAYHKSDLQPRFDIVEVFMENSHTKSIKHLANAFQLY